MQQQIIEQQTELKNIVYDQSECLASAQIIQKSIQKLSQQITKDLHDANPLLLVVMTGGVVFAGQLIPLLNFPLEVDFCQVSRYRKGVQSGELQWLADPKTKLENRLLVIVDDIYDEGTTLLELIRSCEQRGAKKVVTCVLVNKKHNRKQNPNYLPDYVALDLPDRFLVGYGMDYEGLGRNLPGIYAID